VAPLTYQQHALTLATATDTGRVIRESNPNTLQRAVRYLEGFAEHVMCAQANPIPISAISQLRHLASVSGEDSLFRAANDLLTYNEMVAFMHACPDVLALAKRVREAYTEYLVRAK